MQTILFTSEILPVITDTMHTTDNITLLKKQRSTFRLFLLLPLLLLISGFSEARASDGLPAALQAALDNNPAIKAGSAALAASGYAIKTAESGRYPTLTGELEALSDEDQYATVTVRQPLYAFGKIARPIDRAKVQFEADELSLLQLQRDLIGETAASYAQIQGIEEQLVVARDNVGELQKLSQHIGKRESGQLASNADVQLADSRLVQAQADEQELVASLQQAEDQLKSRTRVSVGTSVAIDPALLQLPPEGDIRNEILSHHPDILYREKLVTVAQYAVDIAKISATPTLYAEVNAYWYDDEDDNEVCAGMTLSGTLNGAGLGIVSQVKAAKKQVEAAEHTRESVRVEVQLEIDNLLTNLGLQERLHNSIEAAVTGLQQTRDSYMRQYESGLRSWLDVLNMQRELTTQRLELVQVETNRKVYTLRLATLLGRLDAVAGIVEESEAK